jgi:putative transposase
MVRSAKEECLSKLILIGESSLCKVLDEYVVHYHSGRNHQGKGNLLLFPSDGTQKRDEASLAREHLGGLLRFYYRAA